MSHIPFKLRRVFSKGGEDLELHLIDTLPTNVSSCFTLSDDEECDCGTESTCQNLDPCCTPYMANSTDQCTLK